MSVQVIDTLKPKNNGTFPIVDAEDVSCGTVRLPEALNGKADKSALDATNAAVAGKADAADVTAATTNLQGQINQIVIASATEYVVAPEVAAARVDSEGFEHATLKDRNDYTDHITDSLASDIGTVASIIKNLYDNSTVSDGYITTDGTAHSSDSYKVTDFIAVDSRDTLIFEKQSTTAGVTMRYITAYDTAKNCISTKGAESASTYAVPYGVAYVRITFSASYYDAQNTGKLMILNSGVLSQNYIINTQTVINIDAIPEEIFDSIDEINDDIEEQQAEIDIVKNAAVEEVSEQETVNILSEVSTTIGFMAIDGSVLALDNYKYTNQFEVAEGDVISGTELRCVVAFNNNVVDSSKGAQIVSTYTVPSGVTSLVCTVGTYVTTINKTHSTITYQNSLTDDVEALSSAINNLPPDKISGITQTGYNYADDASEVKSGYYAYATVGNTVAFFSNETYDAVTIPVLPGEYIVTGTAIRFALVANSENIVLSADNVEAATKTLTVPDTITSGYLILSIRHNSFNSLKISKDGLKPETEYTVTDKWVFTKSSAFQPIHAHLPKYVYVAVGRTIELYNNQVCLEADKLHVQWICDVGSALSRKFTVTGETETIGEYSLICNIYDDSKAIMWSGECTLKIVDDALSDSFSCVAIGDSLTNNKKWTPEVINLSGGNISFVGHYSGANSDSEGTSRSFNHEGRSGFTTNSYLTGAPYTFGGGDETEHNVFWNPTSERFDWSYYKTNVNVDPDFVQIFLGTNELSDNNSTTVANFRQIVDYIRQDDANIPIYLINTIYFGTQDGIGKQRASDGYSANFKGYWKYNQDLKVMDLMTRLDAEFEDDANVIMINLAVSHDSEYNFGAVETPVNPRASQTELMPTEGVHPQAQGYFQMADVMYSAYVATLE